MSSPNPPDDRRDVERIEAFSDGIFAFAATLLVAALTVPHGPLGAGLAALANHYYAFALSFFVIGSFWTAHHRLFRHVVRSDEGLLWINLVLLACIAFLPFPSRAAPTSGAVAGRPPSGAVEPQGLETAAGPSDGAGSTPGPGTGPP